MQLSYDRCGC